MSFDSYIATAPHPTTLNEAKRRRLYDQGLSDDVIAKRCGVARVTITAWRLARGLPVNKHPPHQLTKAEENRRKALWKKGLPDVIIAQEVGLTPGAIMRWRQRHGLKGHDYTKWKHKTKAGPSRKGKIKARQGRKTTTRKPKRRPRKRPAATKPRRTRATKKARRVPARSRRR